MLAALPAAAFAQARQPSRQDLAPVVVTATRAVQDPFDLPASVTVVAARPDGGRDVELSQLLHGVPGVLARNRQNHAQDEQISIRGFGARATFGIRGVRLYTDGIPATMPDGQGEISHFNLDSAARVEVLRGPFSALYGNASGGVIELFTADGTAPPQVRLGLAGDSDGMLRAEANARGAGGPFDYNVDFTHLRTDGYRDHSRARRASGNAKLDWQLDAQRSLTLVLNTLDAPHALDPQGLTPRQYRQDPRQASTASLAYDTRKSVSQQQGGLVYQDQMDDAGTLRLMGYYGRRDVVQYLSVPVFAQASPLSAGGVIDLHDLYGGTDLRWTWHDRLAGRPFSVAAGLAWDVQRQHRLGYDNFVGATLGVRGALRRNEDDRVQDLDPYLQATWRLDRAWSVMAGLRHDRVAFRTRDHYVTARNPDDSGRTHYSATTPVAGVMYRLSPRVHLYADYGTGFQTPTFSELDYRSGGGSGLNLGLRASVTHSAELGVKLRPSSRMRADFALFRADSRHELAIATNVGGRTTYQNIGRARRQGLEASLRMRPLDWLRAQAAYTWLDASYRSAFLTCVSAGCAQPDTHVAAGARIPGVPRSHLDLALQAGRDTGWRLQAHVQYLDAVPANDLNTVSAPAYTLLDLGVGHVRASGHWRVHLFATLDNVFDRRHVAAVIVNDGNGRYFEPGAGRTLLLGVDLRWRR